MTARRVRLASVMTPPNLQLSLTGMVPLSTQVLKRQSHAFTRGDAHANSRRWHTARRCSLCSNEDHRFTTASSLDPRRQDQENNQPDKPQPACPSFLEEGLRNKMKPNSGVWCWRLYRSSTRLPVSGRVARIALWRGIRLDAAMVSEAGAFLIVGGLEHHKTSDSL